MFETHVWFQCNFVVIYLRKVYRTTDPKLLILLEEVRWGILSEQSRLFLNDLVVESRPADWPHVTTHLQLENEVNTSELQKLALPERAFVAQDESPLGAVTPQVTTMLDESLPCDRVFTCRKLALVMCLVNFDKDVFFFQPLHRCHQNVLRTARVCSCVEFERV